MIHPTMVKTNGFSNNELTYPRVTAEISEGNIEITGNFTIEEASDLVNILKSGELPFELKILKEQIIKRE